MPPVSTLAGALCVAADNKPPDLHVGGCRLPLLLQQLVRMRRRRRQHLPQHSCRPCVHGTRLRLQSSDPHFDEDTC